MDLEKIITAFGNMNKAAEALGVNSRTMSSWRRRGRIPWYWEDKLANEAKRHGVDLRAEAFKK